MSVSANFTEISMSRRSVSKAVKCSKCNNTLASIRSNADQCKDCFLSANHKRFSDTLSRAGLAKFERILVPFNGDAYSLATVDHLQQLESLMIPLPYAKHNTDVLVSENNHIQANSSHVATVKKDKKQKKAKIVKGDPDNSMAVLPSPETPEGHEPQTAQGPSQETSDERDIMHPQQLFNSVSNFLNTDFITNADPGHVYSPSFPFHPTEGAAERHRAYSTELEHAKNTLRRLCRPQRMSQYYRTLFAHVDGSRVNCLIATQGRFIDPRHIPTTTTQDGRDVSTYVKATLKRTGPAYVNPDGALPNRYPCIRLAAVSPPSTGSATHTAPYLYIDPDTPTAMNSMCPSLETPEHTAPSAAPRAEDSPVRTHNIVGSQLLTHATVIPLLVVPLESILPDELITESDQQRAKDLLEAYYSEEITAAKIDVEEYTRLFSKSFALYRLLFASHELKSTPQGAPVPISPSFYTSVIDVLQYFEQTIYTHIAYSLNCRAIIMSDDLEKISTELISGLTKGRANTIQPRLIRWSRPVAPTGGLYLDPTRVQDILQQQQQQQEQQSNASVGSQTQLDVTHSHVPLPVQIPRVYPYIDAPSKILTLHCFHTNKTPNMVYRYDVHQEYFATTISSKNIDRVTERFITLLQNMNESTCFNIVKTCEKLVPERHIQRLHCRFTHDVDDQQRFFDKWKTYSKPSSSLHDGVVPDAIADFLLDPDDPEFSANRPQTLSTQPIKQKQPGEHEEESSDPDDEGPSCGTKPNIDVTKRRQTSSASAVATSRYAQSASLPILSFKSSSDGWYGARCELCGEISPCSSLIPQPPGKLSILEQRKMALLKEQGLPLLDYTIHLCTSCQQVHMDCDPNQGWIAHVIGHINASTSHDEPSL